MQTFDWKEIKNIVFDLGGVILTLDRNEAVRRFKSAGLENADELLDPYHQKGIFLELEEGKLSERAFYDAVRTEAGKYISNKNIAWGWLGFIADCPEYKLTLLEDLRARGFRLYLLSNTNPVIMKWAMSSAFSKNGKNLSDYFDKLYLSYRMKCVKPHAEIFQKMITNSGMIPEETLFIDDGTANIEMGKQLGFKTYQPVNGEDFRGIFCL
ncbi:D-ribitol-5-phosphate phosphatase [Bacteroidia bacterium]|nr:D-ribitol-5-phosphate phosphatase [Bacteroidia bacterium]